MGVVFVFVCLLALSPVWAASTGPLLQAPSAITVKDRDGERITYPIDPGINTVYVNKNRLALSINGFISRCPPYRGQLAEDITILFKSEDGTQKKVTAVKAADNGPDVSVFGNCGKFDGALIEVIINLDEGHVFNVIDLQ